MSSFLGTFRPLGWALDVLSEIFAFLHIAGSALAEIRCGGDWGIDMVYGGDSKAAAKVSAIPFHYVIEGQCWLLSGATPAFLSTGDLVVAMHWPRHALASSPQSALETVEHFMASNGLQFWRDGTLDRPNILNAGSGEKNVKILSGLFSVKGRGARILIDLLPSLMHLSIQDQHLAPQLTMALEFVHHESLAARPGYVAVANRVMDLLFIQVLRTAIAQPTVPIGLLAGLADTYISRALAAIHGSPSASWTVGSLAQEACLSRTAFAGRFRQLIGMTPIQYVARWRLTLAEDWLARSDLAIEAIKDRLGYGSRFAFARAFRAYSGHSPGEYRRLATKAEPSQAH